MSCWSGWDYSDDKVSECPECGTGVDKDGDAVKGCSWSPVECEKCGWRPCDGSC